MTPQSYHGLDEATATRKLNFICGVALAIAAITTMDLAIVWLTQPESFIT